jgi:TRAP-type mannitol/chloroaromatic compound transport system permease large subunit
VACFLLAVLYKRFNLKLVKDSAVSTIEITVMVLMIVVGSITFSRILATSGAITGLVEMATSLPVPPVVVIIMTQLVVVFLGCFMDPASIVMIAVPMFMPIVSALGFNPLWYAVVLLLNIQLGLITPPFGLDVYTMKALAPPDISVGDVFRSSMPFLAIGFLVMALIMILPPLATWLPGLMVR